MATNAPVGFDGELVLPPRDPAHPRHCSGSRVEIPVPGRHVEITAEEHTPVDRERARQAMKNLQTMFAGEPSLEDEYFRSRDKDKW